MVLKILVGFSVLVGVLVGYAAMQPAEYVISRKINIQAPIAQIFPYLENARLYDKWSPWSDVDPDAKMHYEGPEVGVGAKTSWDSFGQLGKGAATIIEVDPQRRVRVRIEYLRPMEMIQLSDYIVEARGDQTALTWSVEGTNTLFGRIMCLFMSMDKMVGGMFEKGLLKLKTLVEHTH